MLLTCKIVRVILDIVAFTKSNFVKLNKKMFKKCLTKNIKSVNLDKVTLKNKKNILLKKLLTSKTRCYKMTKLLQTVVIEP